MGPGCYTPSPAERARQDAERWERLDAAQRQRDKSQALQLAGVLVGVTVILYLLASNAAAIVASFVTYTETWCILAGFVLCVGLIVAGLLVES